MIDALRRAAGADAVAVPDADRWRVHGSAPQAVVSPANAEAVAAVLTLCSAEGWRVEPAGAGTWLDHGRTPAQPAPIVLSTRRLARRIDTEPADLVAGVDAGVTLDALQHRLAADRQELPLDPPRSPDATLGAVIALASAGPLRASAGTPRDHVLGISMVTGDGRLLEFGGRVVKNVAGYDIVRLLTGSRGTLGVITSLWLRLRARPAADHSFVIVGERDRLLQMIAELGDLGPAAAELLAPSTVRVVARRTGAVPSDGWALAVRLRGGREELAAARGKLAGLVTGLALTDATQDLWTALATGEAAAAPVIRVAGLPATLAATVARCTDFISASGNSLDAWHLAAHACDGVVRLWPAVRAQSRLTEIAGPLLDLRQTTAAAGGTVLLEAARPALQELVPVRGAVDGVT
ncbi:MAG: FAD-binding oxidoreductase, partial [Longimicrobiales bacterium]